MRAEQDLHVGAEESADHLVVEGEVVCVQVRSSVFLHKRRRKQGGRRWRDESGEGVVWRRVVSALKLKFPTQHAGNLLR